MDSHLIKYAKGLVGQYYQTQGNNKLAIMLGGAPGMPKPDEHNASLVSQGGFDYIRPDYYGYTRSDGFFSPQSCIQTAYDTIQTFRQQIPVLSLRKDKEILTPHYDEIVVIGGSFGGWIAAMIPRFDPSIREIVLLYPRLAYDDMDQIGHPEESDEDSLREYALIYKHIYRFADGVDPYDALIDIGTLSPLHDHTHLKDTKIFLAHGTADEQIRHERTREFFQKLLAFNPSGQYTYAEYYGLGHGGICKSAALEGRLHRRKTLKN